jgi:hypothetical protein
LILVAEHHDGRVNREMVDCVEKLETVVVWLTGGFPEIDQKNIGPGKQFFKTFDGGDALTAENESFAESPS